MTYRAIIADDEKELRTYLKNMLAETWPELEICGEAVNGREALEMVEAFAPQIAFLDIKMPGFPASTSLKISQVIAGLYLLPLLINMPSTLSNTKRWIIWSNP
ncbi:MAG: response regulator [Smithella sp.]|jgi:DNA-binding LytR/AlgR family response regulator